MEALAAGTPVIAYRAGDPEQCRLAASERFAIEGMVEAYLTVYGRLAVSRPS